MKMPRGVSRGADDDRNTQSISGHTWLYGHTARVTDRSVTQKMIASGFVSCIR